MKTDQLFETARRSISRSIIERYLHQPGAHWKDDEYWTLNPLRGDKHIGSFHISAIGQWFDHAINEGGDLIELLSKRDGLTLKAAAEKIIADAGGQVQAEEKNEKKKVEAVVPIPEEAFKALNDRLESDWSSKKFGIVTAGWKWKDQRGAWCCTARHEREGADGKTEKDIIPYYYGKDGKWRQGNPISENRPIYRIDELPAPDSCRVLVVEGEKCADVQVAGYFVTTWIGGTGQVKKTKWATLKKYDVTIWPDNDKPGRTAAAYIKEQLPKARVIRIKDKPEKWDIFDAQKDGIDLITFIEENCHDENTKNKAGDPDGESGFSHEALGMDDVPVGESFLPGVGPGDPGSHFIHLGYDESRHYFLPKGANIVKRIGQGSFNKTKILELAPLSWWMQEFPRKGGFEVDAAIDALIRDSEQTGMFQPQLIRGTGVWLHDDKIIINNGHQVTDEFGAAVKLSQKYHYVKSDKHMANYRGEISTVQQGYDLIDLFTTQGFETEFEALALLGWTLIAPFGGILKWRPHVWLTGPARSGKAQPHSAKVLTPSGWTTMGNLKTGDYITTPDNKFGKILKIYPHGKKQIYKITFADGRSTRATADHLWKIRSDYQWRLKTTEEIIYILKRSRTHAAIPLCHEVDLVRNQKEILPLHPYVLGVLIGDGYLGAEKNYGGSEIRLTTADNEIISRIEKLEPERILMAKTNGKFEWRFKRLDKVSKTVRECIKELRLLGSRSHDKFIPKIYLESSIENRWELLRGLMDTDGTVGENPSLSYCTVSEQLANDVCYLVRSLGGVAKISKKKSSFTYNGEKRTGKLAYNISIRMIKRENVFSIERKKERCSGEYCYKDSFYLKIKSIEPDGIEDASCIVIDHPDSLYITDDFIVTHNSWMLENIIQPMVEPFYHRGTGKTSSPGIYRSIKNTACPILLDEMEPGKNANKDTIQKIEEKLELARNASSDFSSVFTLTSMSGSGMTEEFCVRSCFLFASILPYFSGEAVESRIIVSRLKNIKAAGKKIAKTNEILKSGVMVDPVIYQRRIFRKLKSILANLEIAKDIFMEATGDQRKSDNLAPIFSAIVALVNDTEVEKARIVKLIESFLKDFTIERTMVESDEDKLLFELLDFTVQLSPSERVSIAELIEEAAKLIDTDGKDERHASLQRNGIRIYKRNGVLYLAVASSHSAIKRILSETMYAGNYFEVLKRHEANRGTHTVRFVGQAKRAVMLDWEAIRSRYFEERQDDGETGSLFANEVMQVF